MVCGYLEIARYLELSIEVSGDTGIFEQSISGDLARISIPTKYCNSRRMSRYRLVK
jgi:hypothetical protein